MENTDQAGILGGVIFLLILLGIFGSLIYLVVYLL